MINKIYILVLTLLVAISLSAKAETDPKWYAVQVSVTVDVAAGKAILNWPQDINATSYTISKKSPQGTSWSDLATVGGNATSYVDSGLSVGGAYEYQIRKSTSVGYVGFGYVIAGLNTAAMEARGKIVLLVDQTFTSSLASELQRLTQDLIGDGWTVLRHDVSRNDSVSNIKQIVKNDYSSDPGMVRSLFLFGHIPVPYSGDFNPDGHPDHRGAWPADAYYGDMDGNWTDSYVNNTGANYDRNKNVAGDGKFDQSDLPSDVDLEVGRVDLYNMTCFANKVPSKSELDLLRQYLNKDHNFRHGLLQVQRRGLVCDNFGERNGEAFAASGWRNFSSFFGAENTVAVPYGQYFPTLAGQSFLWSYGTGGGSFYTCNGVGSSDDFAITDVQSVFTMFVGSYFGDWDNESNFLRAPLGSATYTLTSSWSGRPHWFYHAMGQGATIGYCTRLSQNNAPGGIYSGQNQGTRQVHSALMGDPTLRMHPVIPASNVQVSGAGVVTWTPSADSNIQSYYIYRRNSNGGYDRVGTTTAGQTSFTDPTAGGSYMVRAIKMEQSGSGTYLNPSQGSFSDYSSGPVTTSGISAPTAPALVSASSSQAIIRWANTAANATGSKVEQKIGALGNYLAVATQPSSQTNYVAYGVTPGTQVYFRVKSFSPSGESAYSPELSVAIPVPSTIPAAVTFNGTDNNAKGNWSGNYGADGYLIAGNANVTPAYVSLNWSGSDTWVWNDATTDSRALTKQNSQTRIASCFVAADTMTLDVNITDGISHQMAFYMLDWDTTARSQRMEVLDAQSGQVLDTQQLNSFQGGAYLIYTVRGHLKFRLTRLAGNNAIIAGIFFGPANNASANLPTPLAIEGNKFQMHITGAVGDQVVVEASEDFANWVPVQTNVLTSTSFDFADPAAKTLSKRFYRVKKSQ